MHCIASVMQYIAVYLLCLLNPKRIQEGSLCDKMLFKIYVMYLPHGDICITLPMYSTFCIPAGQRKVSGKKKFLRILGNSKCQYIS